MMTLEATIVRFKTKQLKKTKVEIAQLLLEEEKKTSLLIDVPFLYSSFPAMIFYNRTILIGQKLNIDVLKDLESLDEYKANLVPWEHQDYKLRETIYELFLEAMSELYFSKDQNDCFRKDFENYKRKRIKEVSSSIGIDGKEKKMRDFLEETKNKNRLAMNISRRKELIRNRERLERLFRHNLEDN